MRGCRVHIAGSAAPNADGPLLKATHEFVSTLAIRLVDHGFGLVFGIGDEPIGNAGLPSTFDWTILEAIAATPSSGPGWPSDRLGRFLVVASQRAMDRIPDSRRSIWDNCTSRPDFKLHLSPPGLANGRRDS